MPVGNDGKPLCCYTNSSESMNNVMRSAKETFLKGNPCVSQLNKIQFTQNVFEIVHAHQMEEMQSAIAWVSEEYVLADNAKYLQVPADVWFELTHEMRKDYVLGIQKLSINDVFQQKDVPWPSFDSSCADERTEFRSLDGEIVEELVNSHGYSKENAEAMKKEVLHLLNHPTAIQRKASLQTAGAVQFEFASASASSKYGTVQVCVCGRYKHDSICKHSLAVTALMSIICAHLNFIRKKSRKGHGKTALAEYEVRKETAGRKGGKNKYTY